MQGEEAEELHKKKKKKSEKEKKSDSKNGFLEEKADSGGTVNVINGGEVEEDNVRLRRDGMKKKKKREHKAIEDKQVVEEMVRMGWENKKRKEAEVHMDLKMDEEPREEFNVELTQNEEKNRQKEKRNNLKEHASSTSHGILVKVMDCGDQMIKKDKEVGKDKRNKRKERNKNQENVANEKDHVVWKNENNKEENIDLGLRKGEECEEMVEIELTKDVKKKKKKKNTTKENRNKEKVDSHSSLAKNIVNMLDSENRMGNGKEVRKEKRNNAVESGKEEEEIAKSKITAENKKKKRDKVVIGAELFENEKFDEFSNNSKRRIILGKDIRKDYTDGVSRERVEDLKERQKEKKDKDDKVTKSFPTQVFIGESTNGRKLLSEDIEVLNDVTHTGSYNKKKIKNDKDGNNKRKKDKKDKELERNDLSLEGSPTGVLDSGKKMIAKDKDVAKNKADKGTSSMKKGEGNVNHSTSSQSTKKSKRVSFSGHVEVFPLSNDLNSEEENCQKDLVQGKRFSPQEDEMVKEAVSNYILAHGLGEEGLDKILHCRHHPEIINCWKDIGAALPWRPYRSVYNRAHILYERSDTRKWDPEDYEIIRRFHEKHGSDWKVLAEAMGKHRFHVKDTWRRTKLRGMKKGHWSQDEYQTLFDLVNMDLRMKAFEEKKTKHGMLRDNISWQAISDKLSTRHNASCCQKWYYQLSSPMVNEGIWADSDDYRLLDALMRLDPCCVEDVDWDNLLEHRSGEVCHKRWKQMTKHIGGYLDKSFSEQVELLSNRYCPDLLEVRDPGGEDGTTDL